MSLILYSTGACHLCEQAKAIIHPVLFSPDLLEEVDISKSDELIAEYGTLIPVLKDSVTGQALNWPFDEARLLSFLQQLEND